MRFLREAEILSKLEHPNVCRLYDLIEDEDCDYIVLERVRGRGLADAVVDVDDATKLRWASEIAEALMGLIINAVGSALGDSESLLSRAVDRALRIGMAVPAKLMSVGGARVDEDESTADEALTDREVHGG